MKIGINTRFLVADKPLEGIGRYTYEVVQRLVLSHPDDEFYFFFDRAFDQKFCFAKNVRPIIAYPPARHPFLFYIWFEWTLPFYLKKYKIDVFFSPDNFCSLSTDVPTLLTIHDLAFLHLPHTIAKKNLFYYRYFIPRFLQKADKIIAISNSVKQDIINFSPLATKEKVVRVYNGLSSTFADASDDLKYIPFPNEKPYFIVVGAIHERKNPLLVLSAATLLHKELPNEFNIIFAGRIISMTSSQKLLWHDLIESGTVIHKPNLNDDEMVCHIKGAQALIFTSLHEGFGLPVLEAMACGTPVITTSEGALPEVGGDAVLYVDTHDALQLKRAMLSLISAHNKAKYRKLGFEQVKKFNWESTAAEVYQLLSELKQ